MPNLKKSNQKNDLFQICHEKCEHNDSDVYIFRKNKCRLMQNIFEVELKPPKCKVYTNKIPATKQTQIDEIELEAARMDICAGKGKKKKK